SGSVSAAIVDELEHRAIVICSAFGCRAEQITVGIGNQAGLGSGPVAAVEAEKGIESVIAAIVNELAHRASAICSACQLRAEPVNVRIVYHVTIGPAPVAEVVPYTASGSVSAAIVDELDHRVNPIAIAICSAIHRRAEQVTVGIGNQAGKGLGPVAAVEAEK